MKLKIAEAGHASRFPGTIRLRYGIPQPALLSLAHVVFQEYLRLQDYRTVALSNDPVKLRVELTVTSRVREKQTTVENVKCSSRNFEMSLTREENLQINRLKNKDLSGETRRNELIRLLDDQLVDTLDLSLHLQRAYWESSECHMEHKKEIRALFDGFGRELLGFVGRLAELIRALGGHPLDRVSIGMHSRLRDYPKDAMTARDHIYALLSSYSQYERITEASIRVMHDWEHHATVVLLQEARRCAERDLWFLEAYLENLVIGSSAEALPTWRSASSMERRLHSREMWP